MAGEQGPSLSSAELINDLADVVHVRPDQVLGWDARNYVQDFRGEKFGGAMIVACTVRLGEDTVTKTIRVNDETTPLTEESRKEAGRVAQSQPTTILQSSVRVPLPTHF
jgi:hypothetical protein